MASGLNPLLTRGSVGSLTPASRVRPSRPESSPSAAGRASLPGPLRALDPASVGADHPADGDNCPRPILPIDPRLTSLSGLRTGEVRGPVVGRSFWTARESPGNARRGVFKTPQTLRGVRDSENAL